ncbi:MULTISPECIES: Trm112 family protein [unclassified Plantactinospora]|uniref:Trm112 family protein n=1 Tax=unclassified Plantactinospora TaxID=2631981 RepID=UPI000D155141|nr:MULTISPECIES: Trm112 family protein [unclassified Plantactinospora]AVT30391.1 tetraacyldisaccharide 4'-kinase [Plantactinospora sp. BC1]AVT36963.1 tetraacyldisaccharide 4'-kinase [Plantactinospora sp. BB1]
MALDPQLLEILACPDTHHAPLDYDPAAQTLTCTECARIFEVRDDVPVLLLDEARGGPAAGPGATPGGSADQR